MIFTTAKKQASYTSTSTQKHIIDLTDCLADITSNIIHDSEYYQLPSDIFENAVFEALNELIDDFAANPDNYLQPKHQQQIDSIAHQYTES